VIEMSQSSWLVAGIVPGIDRHPAKKLEPSEAGLLRLLHRWREEAEKTGRTIKRIAVAFEAGRDGFWLARWLRAHGIEAYVIHPNSIAVSREHRRAKTDRLDTALLKRGFLGWLRGEREHCSMAAIPSLIEEDAKRPSRERESLVGERTRIGNRIKSTLARLGIRDFKPTLRTAAQQLARLRTPEGEAVPPNTLAELRRQMARLCLLSEQIREIETDGWPTSPRIEALRASWLDTGSLGEQRRICTELQMQLWQDVPYIPMGEYWQSTAYRKDLLDMLPGCFHVFYGVRGA
jgi:transposase